ncbi:MAG: hypothetical protein JXB10_17530 [Pirellulales bacterium]|nr:hypothetical protein [Pirellulales bacterium]
MKRLMILAVVTLLTGSSVGCGLCRWPWNRGTSYVQCPPAVTYTDPCAATCTTSCCAAPVGVCDPCCAAPVVTTPGPVTYTPAPTQ